MSGDGLERLVKPGDVLFVRGTGGLADIGATGGLFGHVLVAVAPPRVIDKHSEEAREFEPVWPNYESQVWRVRTIECCRQEKGLHQSEMLIRIEQSTGRLYLIGELTDSGELTSTDEPVEIYQSPPQLRVGLRLDLMAEVLADMKSHSADWSFATAVRAIMLSAKAFTQSNRAALMNEIQECWSADPICTSIVIAFWQRYLCKLACAAALDPIELIFGCMPLKADRGLPGDLTSAMRKCGWTHVTKIPMSARSFACGRLSISL